MSVLKNPFNKKDIWVKSSYSQSGEDLIVKFIFDCLEIEKPSYLDIGAHHPFYLSNTALFYQSGSTGINIEPDPQLFKLFIKHRKKDLNLNIGIGSEKSTADFYIISTPTLNTFSKKQAENYINEGDYRIVDTINIPLNKLENIIIENNEGNFPHFLNIDTEGTDDLIINSIDYTKNYPLVICIETMSFSTSGNGIKNVSIINFLLDHGYMVYADTHINTIFVKKHLWQKNLEIRK
jgi:FkbM family methyltransferase